ncbi:MAG: hypothetical protein B0D88_06370, partial [Candidatus Sedimenticola endophacoides]
MNDQSTDRSRTPDNSAADTLLRVAGEVSEELHPGRILPEITLDSSLEYELGLDSLAMVELLNRVELEFGITVDEIAFITADTPRGLLGLIEHALPREDRTTPVRREPEAPAGQGEIPLPHNAPTLNAALEWHVRHCPDRTHVILHGEGDEPERISYRQLADQARGLAAALQLRGLRPGQ